MYNIIELLIIYIVYCRFSCALPTSMTVQPVIREMSDCPLLRGGHQDTQVNLV